GSGARCSVDAFVSIAVSPAGADLVLPRFLRHPAEAAHIYPLSLHDALPISANAHLARALEQLGQITAFPEFVFECIGLARRARRSEEHTSELQSRENLVCRLLLEKTNWARTATATTGSPRRSTAARPSPAAP